jgi:Fe-S oxidoreductase
MVGLEPSCLAVFRDEMLELRPHDEDAKRSHGQVFTLAEFLTRHDYEPGNLHQDVVVHGHCHQKAIISLDAEKKLFKAMGASAELLDDGCCDMAGSFGFEPHKYEVSMKIYEHEFGPRLRSLPAERRVVADGFSCKTQIEQATGRRPMHLAQLLQLAKHGDGALDHLDDALEGGNAVHSSAWIRNGALALGGVGLILGAVCLGRRILR